MHDEHVFRLFRPTPSFSQLCIMNFAKFLLLKSASTLTNCLLFHFRRKKSRPSLLVPTSELKLIRPELQSGTMSFPSKR